MSQSKLEDTYLSISNWKYELSFERSISNSILFMGKISRRMIDRAENPRRGKLKGG